MQSVLSVQAARAGKATEKREVEGKIVCNAGHSKCNTALEMMGGNSSWVSSWMEAKGFTFSDLLPDAVTVKVEQGLSPSVLAHAPKIPR